MNVIITLCLIAILAIVISTILKFCVISRAEKLKYLKNFKKGKFVLIYIAAIPLYWIGINYNGIPMGASLLLAIKSCVDLVVLKYDYSSVVNLMNNNFLYRITMDICFVLVTINAIIFTLTIMGQSIINYKRKCSTVHSSKTIYVIVGYNNQNQAICKSISNDYNVIMFTQPESKVADFGFIEKVAYTKIIKDDIGETLTKLFKKFDNKNINVIINTQDDAKNLIYTEQICGVIEQLGLDKYFIDNTKGLNGYVFGEPENASSFLHFVEKSKGCVQYVNKYKLIAMDFVGKYPITQFMAQEEIDYSIATIRDKVKMNIVMIGFGKTNQEIFSTSIANNQVMTKKDGVLVEKPINYFIYDKKDSINDKNINHNYARYSNELESDKSQYLPLPPKPANEAFFELDINDMQFYKSLRQNISVNNGELPYNYIIIAFGSDMENLDFADKISAKLKEWNLFDKTKVFVKIRDGVLSNSIVNTDYASDCGFVTFGNENTVVYNVNQIVEEKKELMARNRHLCYALTGNMSVEDENKAKIEAMKKWFSQAHVQRESNVYACLSIRLKLHLIGFDYLPISDKEISANDDYLQKYQDGDQIIYDNDKPNVKGRKIVKYDNNFVNGSLRQTFAIQEHQRWNSYMISCGFIPSTINQIKANENKNMKTRRHGNITTFEGLVKFREIQAKIHNISQEEADVIKYDYQLMDDLVWTLTSSGYKIVNRHN